jgi:hypothetical protein
LNEFDGKRIRIIRLMKLLSFAASVTCCALLCSCNRQAATTSDDGQRIAEEQQAESLSQLHEKQAALDERERVLDSREQQITISPQPPPEAAPAPAASGPAPAQEQAAPAPAYSVDASYQNFYDLLAPYGSWVALDPYGYVWQPSAGTHDFNWRPYTLGHWAYTDDGWTWMSDEAFGWITYHYGRWMRTHTLGWVWTPGDQWAPAWVSWRYGNDFAGWAPLPPEARFDGTAGIQQWADSQFDLGSSDYTFVPAADFGDDSMADVAVPLDQAGTIYDESSNVTNIYYDTAAYAIICYGPSYDFMRSKARRPLLPPMKIRRYGYRHDGENGPSVSGGTLRVTAPRVVLGRSPARPTTVNDRVVDARLVNPATPPPPHGEPVPPLYRPPVQNHGTAQAQAPSVARIDNPARQQPAPVSYPGYQSTPPESARTIPPPAPPAGMRIPVRMEPSPLPRSAGASGNQDLQIIQQQQAAREAEHRQQEAESARAAAEQQQRAEQLRAQQEQAQQAQRAEELRAEESAREQHAAEEAANASAARDAAARQESERAAQSAGAPSGSPAGRGN